LTASGQIAIRALFEEHLKRIDWGPHGPVKLFPLYPTASDAKKVISIAARVSSGRPVIDRRGIRTAAIVERLDAGEDEAAIAADYALELEEVTEAATYERAA
jgi:uncharacterized protein (DUF433 family)